MATDTSAGFKYMGRLSGQPDLIQKMTIADAAFAKGDLVNLESGQIDLAATGDTALVGVVLEAISGGTTGTDQVEVTYAADAVFAVYDANARAVGATLDISGATGAMTVASSSNADLIVIADSTADEWTLVTFNANHFLV